MKLSKRLKNIQAMIIKQYDHIWDCCCDHGLLGASLLEAEASANIHFVDIVPALMQQLKHKLEQFFPKNCEDKSRWHVHCMDVADLPLQAHKGKHLVILAGVGGDLMTEFVKAIYENNKAIDIDFLLCPVHHQFTLRQQLIEFEFSLLNEILMVENQRFYEIILATTTKTDVVSSISPTGSLIWQGKTPEQIKIIADYLSKTLAHYQRMQLNNDSDVQDIIDAYNTIVIRH